MWTYTSAGDPSVTPKESSKRPDDQQNSFRYFSQSEADRSETTGRQAHFKFIEKLY